MSEPKSPNGEGPTFAEIKEAVYGTLNEMRRAGYDMTLPEISTVEIGTVVSVDGPPSDNPLNARVDPNNPARLLFDIPTEILDLIEDAGPGDREG